nr:hypothetical protein [Providencia alcalifaciens]
MKKAHRKNILWVKNIKISEEEGKNALFLDEMDKRQAIDNFIEKRTRQQGDKSVLSSPATALSARSSAG